MCPCNVARPLTGPGDLDIGSRPQREVWWHVEDKVRLALELDDLFGCGRVDLVVLPEADPFLADDRNCLAAESCLWRSLEGLLDVGRHILAKGFALGVSEYKEIAEGLGDHDVLTAADAALLRMLPGYRNRLVHFYHQVAEEELFTLCSEKLDDIDRIAAANRGWLRNHPERQDESL